MHDVPDENRYFPGMTLSLRYHGLVQALCYSVATASTFNLDKMKLLSVFSLFSLTTVVLGQGPPGVQRPLVERISDDGSMVAVNKYVRSGWGLG